MNHWGKPERAELVEVSDLDLRGHYTQKVEHSGDCDLGLG